MPTSITIATFNCENLFKRYKFSSKLADAKKNDAVENGFIIDKTIFETILPEERTLTAQAIKATKADIICLQEVENLDTLKTFQSQFLKQYPFQYLIDGNDPRLIDVAVLSKMEAATLRTHQFDKKGTTKIFSRDCLEIEYNINGTILTLFVNHFKSMLGGEEETNARRMEQSERVTAIIKEKFGNNPTNENFVVVGDFNAKPDSSSIAPLLSEPWIENVVATRLPEDAQWTHFYDREKSVAQLDYLLLSKSLATKNPKAKPNIVKNGLCLNVTQYTGKRFDGIGKVRPSASDHCPIGITLNI